MYRSTRGPVNVRTGGGSTVDIRDKMGEGERKRGKEGKTTGTRTREIKETSA